MVSEKVQVETVSTRWNDTLIDLWLVNEPLLIDLASLLERVRKYFLVILIVRRSRRISMQIPMLRMKLYDTNCLRGLNDIKWKVDEMLKASYGLMGCAINVRRIDRSGLDLSMWNWF